MPQQENENNYYYQKWCNEIAISKQHERCVAIMQANINALEDEVAELKEAYAAKEAMALELVKQRNMALDDLAEARVEIRIARKLLDKERRR